MELITQYINKFISSFIMMFVIVYIWHHLVRKKLNLNSVKLYVITIFLSFASILNYYIVNDFFRILSITIILTIAYLLMFRKKINNEILTPIFTQLIFMISEVVFALIITFVFKFSLVDIQKTQFGSFSANVAISIIAIGMSHIPLIINFYNILIKITDKIKNIHLIIFTFFIILIANVLAMLAYYKVEFSYLLIFNTLLTMFCFVIVLYSFRTKNNYIKVYDKYNTTLNSLKEYEDILDRYRVSNHENKNQLLTIRNMVPKSNKKIINYIDTVVENKIKDNDKVMIETAKIPAGGLRGLIYSKLLLMKNLDINYELKISNNIRTVDLINNINDSDMLDICKIIGVYLDNSIQAVENLDEKYVNIEMYLEDNNLFIAISNNYVGLINLDKIDENSYTSKGEGHGYGLTLAKEIIENNKRLLNERKLNKEIFTQILKIKM